MELFTMQEKRTKSNKVDELNYNCDACIIGEHERPDWEQIILQKAKLCGC